MCTTRPPLWKKLDFETQRSVFSTSKSEINLNATERVLHAFFPASEGLVLLQGILHGTRPHDCHTCHHVDRGNSWIFDPVQGIKHYTLHTVAILGFLRWLSSKTRGTTRSALWKFLDFEAGLILKNEYYTLPAVEKTGF